MTEDEQKALQHIGKAVECVRACVKTIDFTTNSEGVPHELKELVEQAAWAIKVGPFASKPLSELLDVVCDTHGDWDMKPAPADRSNYSPHDQRPCFSFVEIRIVGRFFDLGDFLSVARAGQVAAPSRP